MLERRPAKAGRSRRRGLARAPPPSSAALSVHGASAALVEAPTRMRRRPAFRWPTALAYSFASASAGRKQAPDSPVEVRPPSRRPALHDSEPVRREHERRELVTKSLAGAQARAVELDPSRVAACEHDIGCKRVPADAPRAGPVMRRFEPDYWPWRRAEGRTLRSEVHASSRFVLPAPFGPWSSTIPGSRLSSSDAYERKSRSVTSRTISPRGGWA